MSDHQPHLRRSTRRTAKAPTVRTAARAGSAGSVTAKSPLHKAKRRGQAPVNQEQWLRSLLQNPKSLLTSIDMSDILNPGAWDMLSEESKNDLKELLPPTAFAGYRPRLGSDHPAAQADMEVDSAVGVTSRTKEVNAGALFTDPHFLSAARTFQDHLYSNWLSEAHHEAVAQFEAGLRNGTLAVRWKDEQWQDDNPKIMPEAEEPSSASDLERTASWDIALAGGATQVKLATLVDHGIIRVGDILAYRRAFVSSNLIIEKDVIVNTIDPSTCAVTVQAVLGANKNLPKQLVVRDREAACAQYPLEPSIIQSTTFSNPATLESALLEIDGRLSKGVRPNGNAWKYFSIWRWRTAQGSGDHSDVTNSRGGRENHGTLFYLRGNYYHEGLCS